MAGILDIFKDMLDRLEAGARVDVQTHRQNPPGAWAPIRDRVVATLGMIDDIAREVDAAPADAACSR
ncbi:Acyl-CoA dehydrogenase [Caenorhabditis elegans]|uniref:Acyl-CoA dehydrogenase n=1 Tax=Caenorhabditis elegans TaxID=6239 RepID=Q56VX3_CAEEL|nr:Acyl-CoA dehydrogenase [Caenorhabditis elegans]CAB60844.1 Acyl-CoA dehydrogenase [Caenorhabditis elegans]|eukprot:NP_001021701.1 Uncharacterized protein CELE_Y105E8B.11 [Caenorhabditis elegans]